MLLIDTRINKINELSCDNCYEAIALGDDLFCDQIGGEKVNIYKGHRHPKCPALAVTMYALKK